MRDENTFLAEDLIDCSLKLGWKVWTRTGAGWISLNPECVSSTRRFTNLCCFLFSIKFPPDSNNGPLQIYFHLVSFSCFHLPYNPSSTTRTQSHDHGLRCPDCRR